MTSLVFRFVTAQGVQAAPQAAPAPAKQGKKQTTSTAPCGPKIEGKSNAKPKPKRRFREGEVEVFKKNGVDVLAVWQNLDDPNTLVYLLAYKDRAAREAGWAGFSADPKWTELRTKYFVPLSAKVTFMSATDYSPLK